MAVSYTYTSLRAALKDWAEDSFSDFDEELDDIIAKAELRCLRDLALEIFDETDTSESTASGTSTLALPTDTILLRSLYVDGALVEPRSESYVRYYQGLTADAAPLYYAQDTETSVLLAPTPDATYATVMRIMKRPTGLSSSTATTWLSTHAGDLLFAACMAFAEAFDKAPEDQAAWEAQYQKILTGAGPELRLIGRTDY